MLGWMLKRGENAPETNPDSTLADQPDTPAPIFAARAFKSAFFGPDTTRQNDADTTSDRNSATPSKPTGILLTPGTGAARRKRVSFGHDVSGTSQPNNNVLGAKDADPYKTARLIDAKEKSRQKACTMRTKEAEVADKKMNSDDDWEEDGDADGGDVYSQDITLDINEPHSQSGKYWKEEFDKYQREAKVEFEKLIRYKKLAKSYAQEKDAEAIQLAEMLKDQQQKVIKMEKRIAQNASEIISQHRHDSDQVPDELVSKLAKQTTLAAQYRHRVQSLEEQLEEFLQGKSDKTDSTRRRYRQAASPNTHKTLMETQRELRKARTQVREVEALRGEIRSLRAQLELAKPNALSNGSNLESARATELRTQLKKMKDEANRKDEEMAQLRKEFQLFKEESQIHQADTEAVFDNARKKIAELKREVKSLKAKSEDWQNPSKAEVNDGFMRGNNVGQDSNEPTKRQRLAPLDGEEKDYRGLKSHRIQSRTPRELYEDDAKDVVKSLSERPALEKPKWQPFVPRSPRNRAYLGEDLNRRIENGGHTPAPPRAKRSAASDLPVQSAFDLGRKMSTHNDGNDDVDLLRSKFARLGGPQAGGRDIDGANTNTYGSHRKLSAERRAAARAQVEKKLAEKQKRARRRLASDKENVRPRESVY